MAKPKKRKFTAEQLAAADAQWDELLPQLDEEMKIQGASELECGHLLYDVKRWIKQWGYGKGRKGRWKFICDRYGKDRHTLENWIWEWQKYADIPVEDWVVDHSKSDQSKTAKQQGESENSQQDCEKNTVEITGIEKPKVTFAADDDHDKSHERRSAVECIFVLTMAEKIAFMEAMEALTPLKATQTMYKAVLREAGVTV